jgi:hypothetical protein
MAEKNQTQDSGRKDQANVSNEIHHGRGASSGNKKHKTDFDKGGSTSKGSKRGEEESSNKGRNSI